MRSLKPQPDPDRIDSKESNYLFIAPSQLTDAGMGLYTHIEIHKDEIIAAYKGEILTNAQALKRATKGHDAYFINMIEGGILDSRKTKCFAKYANDVKGSENSPFKNNAKIAYDENDIICLIATQKIKEGSEIFCGYGFKYWRNQKRTRISEK